MTDTFRPYGVFDGAELFCWYEAVQCRWCRRLHYQTLGATVEHHLHGCPRNYGDVDLVRTSWERGFREGRLGAACPGEHTAFYWLGVFLGLIS